LIKLPPLFGGFSGATTKLTGPSTGCGIFSQEKPDLYAQIFPWPPWGRTIRTGQLRKLASVLMQDEGNRERVSSVGRRTKLPVGPYPSRGGAGQHGGA
jgi:hypothetical protein